MNISAGVLRIFHAPLELRSSREKVYGFRNSVPRLAEVGSVPWLGRMGLAQAEAAFDFYPCLAA